MAREKLKHFLLNGLDGEPYTPDTDQTRITYSPTNFDGDNILNKGDDLGREAISGKPLIGHNAAGVIEGQPGLSLINDFLNYLSKDAKSYYEIKGGAIPAPGLSHILPDGTGRSLTSAETANGNNVFIKTDGSDTSGMGASMSKYSDSGYFQNTTGVDTLASIVTKLNALDPEADTGPGPHTGNKLLPSITGNEPSSGDTTFIATTDEDAEQNSIAGVQTMLGARNRFNTEDSRAFAPFDSSDLDTAIEDGTDGVGTRTAQTKFGVFDKDGPVMKNDHLVNVARSMMLQAIGLDWSDSPATATDPNTYPYNNATVSGVATISSLTKEASAKYPRAKNSFGAPTIPGQVASPFEGGAFETGGSRKSYGNSYDSNLQFSNNSNQTVKLRAAAVVLAMIFAAKSAKDKLTMSSYTSNGINLGRSHGIPGQAIRFAADAKTQMFNRYLLPETQFSLTKCLNAGTQLLFGATFDDIDEDSAATKSADVNKYQIVNDSSGFWYSIGRTIIRRFEERASALDDAVEAYTSDPDASGVEIFGLLARTGVVGFISTIAQIGDKVLISRGGETDPESIPGTVPRPFNVDILADSGQTRQSKSRSRTGQTSNSLAWRGSTAPSLYLLPRNVVKAVVEMNTLAYGGNPVKAHTATPLIEKTYIDINGFGAGFGEPKETRSRIPTDVRRSIENELDAEYVPFYFHDVRTNEIVGFHAFLNNLSDSYQPSFTATSGYGRVDPVYTYKDTKRTVTFSFYVAATSKEDFDEMWFKINKLTTMVYPSWTPGTRMFDALGNVITQPFSQKMAATPLIRLRIGDVIKSNYSRFNLARVFGIGTDTGFQLADDTYTGAMASALVPGANMDNKIFGIDLRKIMTDIQLDYVFNIMFGSPLSLLPGSVAGGSGGAGGGRGDVLLRTLIGVGMKALGGSGIVNPIGARLILSEFENPDNKVLSPLPSGNTVQEFLEKQSRNLRDSGNTSESNGYNAGGLFSGGPRPILKASVDGGYYITTNVGGQPRKTGNRIRTVAPYRVKVVAKRVVNIDSVKLGETSEGSYSSGIGGADLARTKLQYDVVFNDLNAPKIGEETRLTVWHDDLMSDPDILFMARVAPYLDAMGFANGVVQQLAYDTVATATGVPADQLNLLTTDAKEFMHPVNNSITRAFEESGGRGLAGVIQSLSYDWIDNTSTWEVDWGSRAPKVAKVNVTFDVIHDMVPGLDHGGYNRGPAYNVGAINNAAMGDADSDEGGASKNTYKRSALAGAQKLKKN